jgi:pyruvate/2-oxoglutarate dehydrogenase complex dihydrolipoamide acyltransferase (E2) component
MPAEVVLPELGLAPGEPVVLSVWFADEGEAVLEGDRLVEVLVAGSTFDVAAPATGRLSEILAFPEDALQPGQVLGMIEEASEEDADRTELDGGAAE